MKDTGEAGNSLHENKAVKRFGHLIGLCNLAAFSLLWFPLSAASKMQLHLEVTALQQYCNCIMLPTVHSYTMLIYLHSTVLPTSLRIISARYRVSAFFFLLFFRCVPLKSYIAFCSVIVFCFSVRMLTRIGEVIKKPDKTSHRSSMQL